VRFSALIQFCYVYLFSFINEKVCSQTFFRTNLYRELLSAAESDMLSIGTNSLHGAGPFFRSCHLRSYSRISQHFMEPKGLLPCSQVPTTRPYPETDQSSPHHRILSKIRLNIILQLTSSSSLWSLSFWLSNSPCVIS
jgi:hypothetical protein